jgi:hypothetical protein
MEDNPFPCGVVGYQGFGSSLHISETVPPLNKNLLRPRPNQELLILLLPDDDLFLFTFPPKT